MWGVLFMVELILQKKKQQNFSVPRGDNKPSRQNITKFIETQPAFTCSKSTM